MIYEEKGRITYAYHKIGKTNITVDLNEIHNEYKDNYVDLMRTVYKDGEILIEQSFENVRKIAQSYFDRHTVL